ncbi:MAG: Uma2 family endonuclease [Solirubrobacteraceae bacterium]
MQVTAEELLALPDDGHRHELVRGELRVMAPPGFEHGRVAARIGGLLFMHLKDHDVGVGLAAETGFLIARDPDTVRAPDAAFVSKIRTAEDGHTTTYWPGAPDLAVEVVSPSDTWGEVEDKALAWLAAGAVAVLVLDPARQTATVYRGQGDAHVHTNAEVVDLGDAVPGFSVRMADVFV